MCLSVFVPFEVTEKEKAKVPGLWHLSLKKYLPKERRKPVDEKCMKIDHIFSSLKNIQHNLRLTKTHHNFLCLFW